MNQTNKKEYYFEKSRGEVKVLNNFDKVVMIILILIIGWFYFWGDWHSFKVTIVGLLIVLPFMLIFQTHFMNFAHKISLHLDTWGIRFYLLRNKGIITAKISDIDNVENKSLMIFSLKDGRKVKWDRESGELVRLLKELGVRVL